MSTNELSLFAENAIPEPADNTEVTVGTVYSDTDWKTDRTRESGEHQGQASSRRYNTALRQAAFGSKLLGDILIARYGSTGIYDNILNNNITTTDMQSNITDIATKLSTGGNFIRDYELPKTKLVSGIINDYDTSKGTVEERLTSLGFRQGSIIIAEGILTPYENTIQRQGNFVILNFRPRLSESSSLILVGTIPEEFRPKVDMLRIPLASSSNVRISQTISSANYDFGAFINILANGDVKQYMHGENPPNGRHTFDIETIHIGYEANPL